MLSKSLSTFANRALAHMLESQVLCVLLHDHVLHPHQLLSATSSCPETQAPLTQHSNDQDTRLGVLATVELQFEHATDPHYPNRQLWHTIRSDETVERYAAELPARLVVVVSLDTYLVVSVLAIVVSLDTYLVV